MQKQETPIEHHIIIRTAGLNITNSRGHFLTPPSRFSEDTKGYSVANVNILLLVVFDDIIKFIRPGHRKTSGMVSMIYHNVPPLCRLLFIYFYIYKQRANDTRQAFRHARVAFEPKTLLILLKQDPVSEIICS